MRTYAYDRARAVAYAHRWAYRRNPKFYNFDGLGGDCTNFASQCILAGAGIMNPTPTFGWYYRSLSDRSPSWTGVEFLHNFLVGNEGQGPFAVVTELAEAQPGDIIQLRFSGDVFQHSPVAVWVGRKPTPANILVAAHTYNTDFRPLSSYDYEECRCLHILGVRK